MPIFKNHCGQFHKMNTALVALTSLYVIGAAVALSLPYWASSCPVLAPLATFATTPLGIGVLTFVAVALIGLAWYTISKNNEISEEKAPKFVNRNGQVMLLVTRGVFEEMKKNNKNKNKEGQLIDNEYYIDFSLEGKGYRVIIGDESDEELGNTLLFEVNSLKAKNSNGEYTSDSLNEVQKKLSEKDGAWVNTYLGELSVAQAAPQTPGKQ